MRYFGGTRSMQSLKLNHMLDLTVSFYAPPQNHRALKLGIGFFILSFNLEAFHKDRQWWAKLCTHPLALMHMLEFWLQVSRMWLFGDRVLSGDCVKMRVLGGVLVLIQSHWCPCKNGGSRTHRAPTGCVHQGNTTWGHSKRAAPRKSEKRGSEKSQLADTLILDFSL